MFGTALNTPGTVSSISLSLSNISASLAPVFQCPAKDALMAEIGNHFASLAPKLIAMDFDEVDGYDEFLRIKSGEAAKIRTCAEKCKKVECSACPFI